MSKLLPNLVMVFAFALCGLCIFQWSREGVLRKDLATMNDDVYRKKEAIQGLEGVVKQNKEEIAHLEEVRKELIQTRKTNEMTIKDLTAEGDRLIKAKASLEQQLADYKKAVETANDSIRRQNEDIKKQNEIIKTLAQQRDDKAAEVSKIAEEYNKVVGEYNKLVEDVKKMNEAAAAAAASGDKKK